MLFALLAVGACAPQPAPIATQAPTQTPQPISLLTQTATTVIPVPLPSPTQFICNEDWQSLSVIPEIAESMRALYRLGLDHGNNPRAFSKIGDGEISTKWFLTAFDLGREYYDLGSYDDLAHVIGYFQGSFGRQGVAAQRGFNTLKILDPAFNEPKICGSDETPLECELRIHNPSIVILSLGTNQVHRPEEFEAGMRQILRILLSKNILPILSTKGDNIEGDHRINSMIACLAQEYQIPLWNFLSAIQPLPNHGLQPDLEHLTYSGINDFDDPIAVQSAWTVRNLTALQVLDAVWRAMSE
jgi:hypothetical protein